MDKITYRCNRMQKLSDIRKDYTQSTLDITTVNHDPIIQFNQWLTEAITSKVQEPNAMNLATINEHGRPTSRIVLLKGIENGKFHFFTNYQSRKGRELENNPACAMTFFWPELERQVRIEGVASRLEIKQSEEYFQSRPRGSQIGAWSSPQSSIIQTREILEERVQQIEKKFENLEKLPRPNQWGGFQVEPFLFEFWQGRSNRLHDRIEFTLIDGQWKTHRLAP
jgi:pyridoxamine 5'-phosphate oxidase